MDVNEPVGINPFLGPGMLRSNTVDSQDVDNSQRLRRQYSDETDELRERQLSLLGRLLKERQIRHNHERTTQSLENNIRNATGDSQERVHEADLLNRQLLIAKQETARIQGRLRTALSLFDTHQSHAGRDWGDSFTRDEALLTLQRDWSGDGFHVEFEQERPLPFPKGARSWVRPPWSRYTDST